MATSVDVIRRGVEAHSHPFQRLCWLLDNVLEHTEHPNAANTSALVRAIVPVLTRDEWVDALAWHPHPWDGGHLLRASLLMHLDLMEE